MPYTASSEFFHVRPLLRQLPAVGEPQSVGLLVVQDASVGHQLAVNFRNTQQVATACGTRPPIIHDIASGKQ